MEHLIENGFFEGVLDLTTTEWADEFVWGNLNAGPNRLEAAAKHGVPQGVSLGALDMVNFGPKETVPEQFNGRNFYQHNPTVTLMRTTADENQRFGEILSEKLNLAKAHTAALILPTKGFSGLDLEGQAFYGPEEDQALINCLKEKVDTRIVEVLEKDLHINDQDFAEAAAEKLIQLIENKKRGN